MEITNPRAERLLGGLELTLGWVFAATGTACYGMWYTGIRGEHHGEIAFLWLYAAFGLPLGIALLIAGLALRRSWKQRWYVQLLVPIWIVGAWALFEHFLLPS